MAGGGGGARARESIIVLSVVRPRMFVQLEDLMTQREPGDWEISVLITDFYSLM